MARYDVCPNPGGQGLLLDVQTDLLSGMTTRMVAPLLPVEQAPEPLRRLNPVFVINETRHVMLTQAMAAVPVSLLTKPLDNLSARSDDITNALDMLFQGF